MKPSLRCFIPLLAICMSPIAGFAQAWPAITLDVTAYVDGRDRLIIKGGTLQWRHFDYAAVGWGKCPNYHLHHAGRYSCLDQLQLDSQLAPATSRPDPV